MIDDEKREDAHEFEDDTEEFSLDYETAYGHCLAKDPYWFIPDLECNEEEELLSWRHAILAVKQGTFESPEHYFWKVIDVSSNQAMDDITGNCGSVISMMDTENEKIVIHGHNSPWGMGISAFSDKVNLWEQNPDDKWILDLAESTATDNEFIATIKEYEKQRQKEFEEWKRMSGVGGLSGE